MSLKILLISCHSILKNMFFVFYSQNELLIMLMVGGSFNPQLKLRISLVLCTASKQYS